MFVNDYKRTKRPPPAEKSFGRGGGRPGGAKPGGGKSGSPGSKGSGGDSRRKRGPRLKQP
jgi:hypothetical protein